MMYGGAPPPNGGGGGGGVGANWSQQSFNPAFADEVDQILGL